MTQALLLALLLLGKAPKAPAPPASPLGPLRAAVSAAPQGCRDALKAPLASLEQAVGTAGTPEGRDTALQVLTDVFSAADGADCSDEVRLKLTELRRRLASAPAQAASASAAPTTEAAPAEMNRRDLAIRTLELAQRQPVTKKCEAAAGPWLDKWLSYLHGTRPAKAITKEMQAKAKGLARVCPQEVPERINAAAMNLLAAD